MQHPGGKRNAAVRVEDDPHGVLDLTVGDACGQPRVVRRDGADTDQDGIHRVPQLVHAGPGGFPGDPFRVPGPGGDPPVQCRSALGDDKRPPRADVLDKNLVERLGRFLANPQGDLNPPLLQEIGPAAGHGRVGVLHADDDPPDAGLDDLQRAGRRPTGVVAGLEVDV